MKAPARIGFHTDPTRVGPGRIRGSWLVVGLCAIITLPVLGIRSWAQPAENAARVRFHGSIVDVPSTIPAGTSGQRMAMISRTTLTPDESAAPMDFELMLTMRNFSELSARLACHEIISQKEMAAKYFPLPADYDTITGWLGAQGFTITQQSPNRLSVFARGAVARVADVFQTTFARVLADGAEYTSAITAPNVPKALAPALLGIGGLQPHVRAYKHATAHHVLPDSLTSDSPPYTPAQILNAYGATTTGLTGAGQTIAVVIDSVPADSDLSSFWTRCGISRSGSIQKIPVVGSSLPTDTTGEATLDVEMTSSLAPAANVRIYAVTDLSSLNLDLAYERIISDLSSQPTLHQLNLSFGNNESENSRHQLIQDDQLFATLAAGGVTIFAAAGDGGSNPDARTGNYNPQSTLQPSSPASDPNVTAVGGTSLYLNSATGAISSETGWSVSGSGSEGSGGGISNVFPQPDWQTGKGVLTGGMRQIPDVAAVSDPSTGSFLVFQGRNSEAFGGTSLGSPIWTAFCALLNQARAAGGLTPLGLFGPYLYPLIGTASLHDITVGNNGAYSAGVGYDLVTGVGTPNFNVLALALGAAGVAPAITVQPVSLTMSPAQNAIFTTSATGNPAPTYQWQHEPVGSSTWTNLSDTTTYTGSATTSLTVNAVTTAMSGDSFRCVVTNSVDNVTTLPAVLVVATPLVVSTLAGQAGISGSANGTGNAAQFNGPADLAVDSSRNVYVADANNHTIRKITPAGVVTTLAGQAGMSGSADGSGSSARFNHPTGIGIDTAGNLYVVDTSNDTVRKITAAGVVSTVAGLAGSAGSTDGTGSAGRFSSPSDVAVDSAGDLYVSDSLNHTIREITPTGVVTTLAGLAGTNGSADGSGSSARFFAPEGITIDSSGNLYVADTNNHAIRKITASGVVSTLAGLAGASGSRDGSGSGSRFFYPADITVAGTGTISVIDTDNHTVRQITSSGLVATVAGLAGTSGSADGTGSSARFFYPTGIAADASGNLYVADTNNQTIRVAAAPTAPTIQTQPQSQTVTVGSSVSFSVVASGVPTPTYLWYFNSSSIAGATSDTLTLGNVQTASGGVYTVQVSNAFGSVTSNSATLTINPVTTMLISSGSSGGGGGGGGAPSIWFCGALSLLALAARVSARKASVSPAGPSCSPPGSRDCGD
jgi:kumamolisin